MLVIFAGLVVAGLVGGATGSWLALVTFKPFNLFQRWRKQAQKPGPLVFKAVESAWFF